MDFPMEIGHVEEIEEHIEEQDETDAITLCPEASPVAKAGPQKIVLIQTPQGGTRAVRVQASASNTPGTSSGIQYVRTDAGLVPVRSLAPRQQVLQARDTKSFVIGKPVASNRAPQTVTKTITLAQAQQMGLLGQAGTTPASRVITLNPTIKAEPGTAKVVAQGPATKVRPIVNDSPRIVQVPPGSGGQSRLLMAAKTTPKHAAVQYIELEESPSAVYQAKQAMKKPAAAAQQDQHKVKVSDQTADRLLQLEGTVVIPGHNQAKIVMLPPDYMHQLVTKEEEHQQDGEAMLDMAEMVEEGDIIVQSTSPTPTDLMVDLAAKKRPCNCTKSQCLKLYCECFANGEFCSDCNCRDCFNTIEHEEERQSAIYNCLERNPNAFRPKIGKVNSAAVGLRHHKGCHCKRSGCLKNYCECFEAKIPCSDMCKCVDCKNSDDHCGSLQLAHLGGKGVSAIKRAAVAVDGESRLKANEDDEPPPKQPYNFMTADVVDATVQCMMAQADECQQNGVSYRNTERLILEEFGRCLAEIIDFSNKNAESE